MSTPDIADLRAKLAAAEARVGNEHAARANAVAAVQEERDAAIARAEKAEAAAGQMRAALEVAYRYASAGMTEATFAQAGRALATDAGKGWVSPEAHAMVTAQSAGLRAALERIAHLPSPIDEASFYASREVARNALDDTFLGRGYMSPEQVAQACAAARDAALEEALIVLFDISTSFRRPGLLALGTAIDRIRAMVPKVTGPATTFRLTEAKRLRRRARREFLAEHVDAYMFWSNLAETAAKCLQGMERASYEAWISRGAK